jgi:hypothetical protein
MKLIYGYFLGALIGLSGGLSMEASQQNGLSYRYLEIRSVEDLAFVPTGNALDLILIPDPETEEFISVVLLADDPLEPPPCTPDNEKQQVTRVVYQNDENGVEVGKVTHRYVCLCSTWVKNFEAIDRITCAGWRRTWWNSRNYRRLNPNGACSYGFDESVRDLQSWERFRFSACEPGVESGDEPLGTCLGPSRTRTQVNTFKDFETQALTSRIRTTGRKLEFNYCPGTEVMTSYEWDVFSHAPYNLPGDHHDEFPIFPDDNPPN